MNRISVVARWFAAMLALAFAMPVFAAQPQKLYVLNADATVATGTGKTVTVRFTNVSPDGNSTFGSLKLSVSGFKINSVSVNAPFTGQPGTPTLSGGVWSVVVNNINLPVKPNDVLALTVNVDAPCGAVGNWFPLSSGGSPLTTVSTGSSLNGQPFESVDRAPQVPRNYTTQASTAQGLAFKVQPQDAYAGAIITGTDLNIPAGNAVEVEATQCGTPWTGLDGQSMTLAKVAGSGDGTLAAGTFTATISGSSAKFTTLSMAQSGTAAQSYSLVASAGTLTSPSSSAFQIFANDGTLPCGGTANSEGIDITRGLFNKDGETTGTGCELVVYDVKRYLVSGKETVEVHWDTGLQPFAVLKYSVPWAAESVNPATGMPFPHQTWVAWQADANGPIYRFAVACLSSDAPAPYGKVTTAALNDTDVTSTVYVDTTGYTAPPASPGYPIVIGTERMQVTAVTPPVSGNVYALTVTRATGLTTKAPHALAALVMSTPLPIDNNTTLPLGGTKPAGDQAMMCVWDEGWAAIGGGLIRFVTSVFDIGDGWLSRQ